MSAAPSVLHSSQLPAPLVFMALKPRPGTPVWGRDPLLLRGTTAAETSLPILNRHTRMWEQAERWCLPPTSLKWPLLSVPSGRTSVRPELRWLFGSVYV